MSKPDNLKEKLNEELKAELRKKLTPQQFHCTQEGGTERPFENPYWNQKEPGLYVDVVNGEPLFSSLDKYDSGTGWPSFTQPLDQNSLVLEEDLSFGMKRTEVRSQGASSHLGHVFEDGPLPQGTRYCINSASLRFVPLAELKEQGYGEFLFLFAEKMNWDIATFAGGCFWGMEELFGDLPGVIETRVGYTGGSLPNATYEEVRTGKSEHAEAIQILFDPEKVSYSSLLERFFKIHDPTTLNRQGNDLGSQYRSAIFYRNSQQREAAEKMKARVEESGQWKKPLVTRVDPAQAFWSAEEDHQKYLKKNPHGYTCHFARDLHF